MRHSRPVLIAIFACALGAGCRRGASSVPSVFPNAPVVLISVDTLRSDHLTFYGSGDVETPALSAFRRDAVLFERAYSPVPLTLPAHASLLTGRLPIEHGIHDNAGYRLRPDVPTIAELLRARGYRSGAAVSAFILGTGSGISRGFDFYDDAVESQGPVASPSLLQRSGSTTAAALRGWIEKQGKEPFVAFLHLYEPHAPYDPPEPYRTKYAARLYDGEIAAADAIVGEFLGFLKGRGLYDRSLIFFLSDHGESLGEHGEDEHGILLHRSVLQVPLLMKLPGQPLAGTSVKDAVSLTDIYGTIARATASEPSDPGSGPSLVALARGERAAPRLLLAETFYPRLHFGWADLASILDGRWHYVDAPSPEFYDMGSDPAELENLASKKPDPIRAMSLELSRRRSAFRAPEPVRDEERKKLAALGYLSAAPAAPGSRLLDPKDEIGTVRELRTAMADVAGGRPAEAIGAIERILAKSPSAADVWELYADALSAAGRPADALVAGRKAVEMSPPSSTLPLLKVSGLALAAGKPDDAIGNARLALERGDPGAHEALARAYLAKGDFAAAEREARQAMAVPRMRARALLALAHVALARHDDRAALKYLEELGTAADTLPGAHYLHGDVLARNSRFAEAVLEFEAEIRLFPMRTEAYVGLALTRSSQSQPEEAKRILLEMVRVVGTSEAYDRASRALTFLGANAEASALREEARRRANRWSGGPG